ncbi:Hypothetical protein BN69_0286 [Methylocystis sp. SC2]|nr:Hypothetical protein BN69_0286 [Methylocystis sp. SC2]
MENKLNFRNVRRSETWRADRAAANTRAAFRFCLDLLASSVLGRPGKVSVSRIERIDWAKR